MQPAFFQLILNKTQNNDAIALTLNRQIQAGFNMTLMDFLCNTFRGLFSYKGELEFHLKAFATKRNSGQYLHWYYGVDVECIF